MYEAFFPKLNNEQSQEIIHATLDDSSKLIEYFEEVAQKQRKYNIAILISTLFSTICGIISVLYLFLN